MQVAKKIVAKTHGKIFVILIATCVYNGTNSLSHTDDTGNISCRNIVMNMQGYMVSQSRREQPEYGHTLHRDAFKHTHKPKTLFNMRLGVLWSIELCFIV